MRIPLAAAPLLALLSTAAAASPTPAQLSQALQARARQLEAASSLDRLPEILVEAADGFDSLGRAYPAIKTRTAALKKRVLELPDALVRKPAANRKTAAVDELRSLARQTTALETTVAEPRPSGERPRGAVDGEAVRGRINPLLASPFVQVSASGSIPPVRQGAVLARPGSSGDAVRSYRESLNRLLPEGTQALPPGDRYDEAMTTAVANFQRRFGLNPTGSIDAATARLMRELDRGVAHAQSPTEPRHHLQPARPQDDPGGSRFWSYTTPSGQRRAPVKFVSRMSIDADGGGDAWRSDIHGNPLTSLEWRAGGRTFYPNPMQIPYTVLYDGYAGARLGDCVEVLYKGKRTFSIYADNSDGHLGEASIRTAQNLGIEWYFYRMRDGRMNLAGGVDGGVTYIVYPGSAVGRQPITEDEIFTRCEAYSRQARGS